MDNLINFGDFCRQELGMQCQYGYYYFKGLTNLPEMGVGLKLHNDHISYHMAEISQDDAIAFMERVISYRNYMKNGKFGVKLCVAHNECYEKTCPKCRDESLPIQYSRGKSKLFKS